MTKTGTKSCLDKVNQSTKPAPKNTHQCKPDVPPLHKKKYSGIAYLNIYGRIE